MTYTGKGLPIMQAQGDYVVINNNTFKHSTLGSAISVSSPNTPLVKETSFISITGTSKSLTLNFCKGFTNAYVSVENSGNAAVRDVKFIGCNF
jgi:hypothetical protein